MLIFSRPRQETLVRLRRILAAQSVHPFKRMRYAMRHPRGAACRGSLATIMKVLGKQLRKDDGENTREFRGTPVRWDYHVLQYEQYQPGAIHIITRLTARDRTLRNMLYGSVVQRVAADEYLLWMDY